jgi:hypothetical protein
MEHVEETIHISQRKLQNIKIKYHGDLNLWPTIPTCLKPYMRVSLRLQTQHSLLCKSAISSAVNIEIEIAGFGLTSTLCIQSAE